MKTKFLLAGIVAVLLSTTYVMAQQPRFGLAIVAGLNFSELEGKDIMDYFGPNVGLMTTAHLSKRTRLGLEILFSQNGEYILPAYHPDIAYGKIRLNHLEIPLHYDWLIDLSTKNDFAEVSLSTGIAYTWLFSYYVENSDREDISDQIRYRDKSGYLLQFGTTCYLSRDFGINLRATLPYRLNGLGWSLAARVIYSL